MDALVNENLHRRHPQVAHHIRDGPADCAEEAIVQVVLEPALQECTKEACYALMKVHVVEGGLGGPGRHEESQDRHAPVRAWAGYTYADMLQPSGGLV